MDRRWNRELVREPVVDGLFYPDDPKILLETIEHYISHAQTVSGSPLALFIPNAAIDFCGKYCAESYKRAMDRDVKRIIIIAPRRGGIGEQFLLPESTIFKTPLGSSKVDVPAMETLLSSSTTADISEVAHLEEHGIEVQLPWIQRLFPEASIVPILLNPAGSIGVQALASALYSLELEDGISTLYIGSGNASGALPVQNGARSSGMFLDLMLEGRWSELLSLRKQGELTSESISLAAALSLLTHRRSRVELLARGSSHLHDGNDSSAVEYASLSWEKQIRA